MDGWIDEGREESRAEDWAVGGLKRQSETKIEGDVDVR